MPDPETYQTESYFRRQLELGPFAGRVLDVMTDLTYKPYLDRFEAHVNGDKWLSDNDVVFGSEGKGVPFSFHINSRFYAPGGKVISGKRQSVSADDGSTGQYTTIRNGGTTDIEHEVDKSVTLEHTESSELSEGIQLDMTTKVSAEYGGVSGSLEQHLGITVDATQATSSSSSTTTAFSDKVIVPGGAEYAIVYKKSTARFRQPYDLNASADLDFVWYFNGHWGDALDYYPNAKYLFTDGNKPLLQWSHNHSRYELSFKSIHEFIGFVRGYDTRAPGMRGYLDHGAGPRAQAAVRSLEDESTLWLRLSGTKDIVIDGNAEYSVLDVKGIVDDQIKDQFSKPGATVPSSIAHKVVRYVVPNKE